MFRELDRKELIYNFHIDDVRIDSYKLKLPEYDRVYKKIDMFIDIDKRGYNLFLVDAYSPEKIDNIVEYIKEKMEGKSRPDDICLVVSKSNKNPKALMLPGGYGKKFTEVIENIQEDMFELAFSFYNELFLDKRDNFMEDTENRRDELLEELINKAKERDIEIRYSDDRFAFIPVKDDKAMTEQEYDDLSIEEQDEIVEKIKGFKKKTKEILYKIKDIEEEGIDIGKDIFKDFITKGMEINRDDYYETIEHNDVIKEIVDSLIEELINDLSEVFTNSYGDDEKKLSEIIFKYKTKVLIDNSENDHPLVIFEDDPTMSNLVGSMDYESVNGSLVAELDNIKAGSLVKANQGVIIMRISSLLKNINSYYYLKKTILTDKVDLNYNRGHLDLLSIGGFRPEPIEVNTKVVLVGDEEYFDLLYTRDPEFAETFKLKSESDRLLKINDDIREGLVNNLVTICKQEKLKPLTNKAIKEIAKYLSRKAGSKNKVYFDYMDITKLLTVTNNYALAKGKHNIDASDVRKYLYPDELIEDHILESYKNKKILINCIGESIGKVNALSVIDLGYHRFGRALRLTCTCCKGNGQIIDVQKESDLSGKVHTKAVNILKGFMSNLIGGYNEIPVDFHISFEQVYGVVEGDSASVAEAICMISACSRIGIKQNIAVTGSINQYGEVQPIGGVNEKIEGFFKLCSMVDTVNGKGVLIPHSNKDDLVLSNEVEDAILKGQFKIYTMESLEDAIEVLMSSERASADSIIEEVKKELKKYVSKKSK